MKNPILYAALCLSGTALAQDTTYFKQDFEDYRLRTWAEHVDNRDTETFMALPHVKFNRIRGGRAERALLDTTLAGVVLDNRSLEVFIPDSTRNLDGTKNQDGTTGDLPWPHFGRSISYYFGGRIVRGDESNLWPTGTSRIYDSFICTDRGVRCAASRCRTPKSEGDSPRPCPGAEDSVPATGPKIPTKAKSEQRFFNMWTRP